MTGKRRVLLAAFPLLITVAYLATFRGHLFLGDGYIFLAYARNIASGAGWSINAGETSFATTSPLWTLVLACLFRISTSLFRISADHFLLAACLAGALCYCIALYVYGRMAKPAAALLLAAIPFCGLFYALSAMETGLFLLLFMLFLQLFAKPAHTSYDDVAAGILGGLLFLARPEGLLCALLYIAFRRNVRATAIVLGISAAIAAPWEWFVYSSTGHWLPTSGNGRLYGYFGGVYPGVSIADYESKSVLWKVAHMPTVVLTQIVAHPVMIAAVLLPFIAISVTFFLQRTRLTAFAFAYACGNLAMYLLLQPLLFQRYFIALLPLALLALPERTPRWLLALAIVAANVAAVPYYRDHVRIDRESAEVITRATAPLGKDCRLATEKLGHAAWITRCYIIDTGGLVDPEVWNYWRAGRSDVEYARTKGADVIIRSDNSVQWL